MKGPKEKAKEHLVGNSQERSQERSTTRFSAWATRHRPAPLTSHPTARAARATRAVGGAAALGAVILLSGCGSFQQLPVRDDSAPSAALRAAVRPQAWARSDKPGPGFEAGFERVRANDVRTLATGESLTLNGQPISGPGGLPQRATVQVAHLVYTHPFRFGSQFELEPFGGLASVKLRYRATPAGAPAQELATSRTALIGGITPRLRLNEWAALEARFSVIPLSNSDVGGGSVELAAVLMPIPQLALRLGYARRSYGADFQSDPNFTTQLEVGARGPFAALQFEF